ncbi:phage regulatory CII family protein [Ancylobacter sp. VNQ12]|uniref:phage regulatory CII family protein n=1 Tax=Ancylobacter sp. VNQ12 TaxID=3400920 RepID=UPI003C0D99CD
MTGRIFTAADYASLKNAVRRACQQAGGGLRGLASQTRLSPAQLSRFGDINSDQSIPLDVALDLDSLAGEPIIASALSERLGFDLVPQTQAVVAHATMPQHLSGLARESGEAISHIAAALADNQLTPNELIAIERELGDVDAQVQSARATVRAMIMNMRGEG